MTISKDGNANYVISGAKLVIHKDCTTALQTYLMGIPSISLGTEALRLDYAQWAQDFSLTPNGFDETIHVLNMILSNSELCDSIMESVNIKARTTLDEWFAGGGECSKKLVESILSMSSDVIMAKNRKIKDSRSILAKLKTYIRRYLPLHYKVAKASRETMTEYSKEDVVTRLNLFEEVDPLGIKLSVKKVFPNTFLIKKV